MDNHPDFAKLHELSATQLMMIGCQKWNDAANYLRWDLPGKVLWLFPERWYKHIPDGFELMDILGNTLHFKAGETDNDTRGGFLAYGVLR